MFLCDYSSRATETGRTLGPVKVDREPGVGRGHEVGVLASDGVHGACYTLHLNFTLSLCDKVTVSLVKVAAPGSRVLVGGVHLGGHEGPRCHVHLRLGGPRH